MNALGDLMQKDNSQTTDLEFAVIVLSEIRPEEAERAAAELAQLRADLQAAQARSTDQARQLEEARIQMIESKSVCGCEYESCPSCDALNVWLAANAPQPQEQSA